MFNLSVKNTALLFLTLPILGFSSTSLKDNQSFSKTKKVLLKQVYYDHKETFYCQVPFEVKQVKGKEKAVVNPIQDGFHYRKNETRASRIEWEHIMPAENFGRQLACWYKGDSQCIDSAGKSYKGRKCCEKTSKQFRLMQADPYNLVPAIGEVNGDRSNYRFADTNSKLTGQYGKCAFKVDFKERKAYPADYTKGFIGRAYLYMADTYKLKLSKQDRQLMEAWANKYPISDWEKTRKQRIDRLMR
ncbi:MULTISPECIES: endonuclease [Cysteiniphilum]|uniref:endonuclease n=1 Tax=Cysteiniphilum TaxID=2056696 RepID=UPI0017861EA2|nr:MULTISPECIES: endonuclease [Cysteiniphilum]